MYKYSFLFLKFEEQAIRCLKQQQQRQCIVELKRYKKQNVQQ